VEDSGRGGSCLSQAGGAVKQLTPASGSGCRGRAGAPRSGCPRWAGNRAREERWDREQRRVGGGLAGSRVARQAGAGRREEICQGSGERSTRARSGVSVSMIIG
jgi:hypothetical protein